MTFSDTRAAYELQRAVAHLAAPAMRATGFRFQKSSRGHWINLVVDRVAANLLADGIKPDRMKF
jgi:hypothetical protein